MFASYRAAGHCTHPQYACNVSNKPLIQRSTLHLSQITPCSPLLLHPHRTCTHNRQQQLKPAAVGDERGAATTVVDPQNADNTGAGAGAVAVAGSEQQQQSWVWEDSDDGAAAYAAFFLWLALGSWPALQSLNIADLPYFIGLGVLTVYIGAHRGLTSKTRQQLTVKEGALAPVLASCSLFGLYLLLKYFPDLSLQTFLDGYFFLLGTAAITGAARPLLRKVLGPLGKPNMCFGVPDGLLLDDQGEAIKQVRLSPSDLLSGAVALGLAGTELASHHSIFTLNNMVACLVATEILALVGLRSFKTAALLLVGLLAYDVFWVFGSPSVVGENVMLEVATSDLVVGPTRLLFPRAAGGVGEAADFPFSLLGLGDIAIPGLLAGLALRFDAATAATAMALGLALAQSTPLEGEAASSSHEANSVTTAASSSSSNGNGSNGSSSSTEGAASPPAVAAAAAVSMDVLKQRPYFTNIAAAHVAGLLAAFAANSITHMGQPALLYIVPCTLLTLVGTAAAKGDLARVWHFTDVPSFGVAALSDEQKK